MVAGAVLDALLGLFGNLDGAAADLFDGTLKLRYSFVPFNSSSWQVKSLEHGDVKATTLGNCGSHGIQRGGSEDGRSPHQSSNIRWRHALGL